MARAALPVNKKIFEQAVQEAETNGPLANQSALCVAVAEKYNLLDSDCKISPAVVRLRLDGWKIQVKTLTRPKMKSTDKPEKIEKPVSEKPISAAKALKIAYSGSCGCGHMVVDGPAGDCPANLNGIDEESVSKWAAKVIAAGHTKSLHYSVKALKYFVRKFYEYNSPEWRTVVNILLSLADKATSQYEEISEHRESDEHVVYGKSDEDDDFSDLEDEPF